ncbi:serine/threonine protein kinase [Acinetobacter sp. ANC 4558]|nr:serine/threonine protein kinase [Acinetobacter sp. ANC 4558]
MTQIYSNFLNEMSPKQKNSIQSYDIKNQKVWLKKASSRHSTWIYLPLSWISKLLNLNMLRPVPNYGGARAIQCEVSRIKQLAQLNISVPTILAFSSEAVLLQDLGQNHTSLLQLQTAIASEQTSETRLSLYFEAIQQIQQIHDLNGYLSEAFSRNILVDQNRKFSFIDFETDPREVLSLQECHIRDWLCFIFSTASCFQENELEQISEFYINHLSHQPEIYHSICRVGKKVQWILKFKPEKLGGDGRRLRKCILLLSLLNKK